MEFPDPRCRLRFRSQRANRGDDLAGKFRLRQVRPALFLEVVTEALVALTRRRENIGPSVRLRAGIQDFDPAHREQPPASARRWRPGLIDEGLQPAPVALASHLRESLENVPATAAEMTDWQTRPAFAPFRAGALRAAQVDRMGKAQAPARCDAELRLDRRQARLALAGRQQHRRGPRVLRRAGSVALQTDE